MTKPAEAHEADALYRPLAGVEAWAAVAVDESAWERGLARLRALAGDAPACAEMVERGAMLAAAHESGALASMHAGDRDMAIRLLRGEASPGDLAPDVGLHVAANYEAMHVPDDGTEPEAWLRRVHEVACRPQLTHAVAGEHGTQDHVLATGDYKHHPNHVLTAEGDWHPFAPVAHLRREMANLVQHLAGDAFADPHPVAQAAYAHHAIAHVAPFADGNGRVARALASASLLRAASVPLLVFADQRADYDEAVGASPSAQVEFVLQQAVDLIGLMEDAHTDARNSAALARWCREAETARTTHIRLPAAVDGALARHRRRPDLGWLSRLDDTVVETATRRLVIRAQANPGSVVEEVLDIDPHPLAGSQPVLRAVDARLQIGLGPEDADPGPALEAWLDRVVSCLALRVAAEIE